MRQASDGGPAVGQQVIFGLDRSGVCTLSIGPGLKNLGVQPHQLEGQNLLTLYGSDASAVAHLRRALAGETFTVEREFGGRILSVFYQPVRNSAGAVTGAFGVSTDVTEQRRVEAEARASRERLRLLSDLFEALTREVLDLEAMLRLAVSSMTRAVGEVGVIWLRTPAGDLLEPRAASHVHDDGDTYPSDWWTEGEPSVHLPLAEAEALSAPQVLDLDDTAWAREAHEAHGGVLAGPMKRFGPRTVLRVPLRSRGHVLGMVDVARSDRQGAFAEDDLGLASSLAERCALALDNALLLEAERESRDELVKFQALADASENLIGITDNDHRVAYSNPRVAGYGIEVDGVDAWAAVATLAGEPAATTIRSALETTGRWSGDLAFSVVDRDAVARVEVFSLSHPVTGEPLGTAWIGEDVTELRSTEAALRAANTDLMKFKALVDASPDFIAIANMEGRVEYLNPGGRKLVGMDPDADVTTITIADYATPGGWARFGDRVESAVFTNGHWEGETTLRDHRGGPPISVATSTFLVSDADTGQPFAVATVQRDITERLAAETALRELADQRQALLTRLVDAQDAERARIAADVHDDPVQACAAVDLRLGLLRRQVRERAPELLAGLDALQVTVSGATGRLRALLFDLEPPDLERGLTGALSRAAEEIFENTEVRWTVDADQEPDVPDATRGIAYRIAKEAMLNACKHAGAQHVVVTVSGREGGLEVSVDDDGVGIGPDPTTSIRGHRGLSSMRDRAAVAGGRFATCNREGGGTRATVWLPGRP